MRDNTQIASKTQTINIINDDGTPRVDSRIIAERLGIQHEGLIRNISNYSDDFQTLGLLRFENEAVKIEGQRGTKYHKYALLNEDQTIFALTLSRNTPEVVQLKLDLTVAFRNARQVTTQPTMLEHARVNKELMSLFGIESNMQTLALNNAMQKKFGVNLLDTWGMNGGLKAERQEQLYTVTEIAKKLGVSRTAINPILIELGLQTGESDGRGGEYN
jgi:phage regulator Rha-like protein